MFKKILIIILIFNCIFVFSGCDNSKSTINNDIEKTDVNNQNSTKEPELKEITSTGEISYELFRSSLTPKTIVDYYNFIDEELFPFEYKSAYGYADARGNIIIKNKYKKAYTFVENKAFVKTMDDTWHIIDTKDNVLFDLPTNIDFDKLGQLYFKNGVAISANFIGSYYTQKIQVVTIQDDFSITTHEISSNDDFNIEHSNIQVINTKDFLGIIVYRHHDMAWEYDIAVYDQFGNLFLKYDSKNMSNTIGSSLHNLTELTPKEMIFFNDGYVNVMNNDGLWGIMNIKTKEMLIDYKYDYIGKYSKFGIPFCSYGKWGCCNSTGIETVKPKFDYISNYDEYGNYFTILNDCEYYINDNKVNYSNIFKQNDGYSFVYPFTNSNVTLVGTPIYHSWMNEYLISESGKVLMSFEKLHSIEYLSNKYVFADNKMYEIILTTKE